MILLIHILAGLVSVITAIVNMTRPSILKQNTTKISTAITVFLGIVLLFEKPHQLGRVCITGLVLISLTVISVVLANKKMHQYETVIKKHD